MPMTAAVIGSAALPVIGGLIGQDQAKGQLEAAQAARQQALAQYANIHSPDIQSQLLALQQYQNAGQLNPALQQTFGLNGTAQSDVSTDPRLKADQMSALSSIGNIAQGNLKPSDMAGYELARQNAAGELNAQNNSVLQNMQERGQAGSGAELLARLKNDQSGTSMLQNAQLQQAQAMQQARISALAQQANMATNVRGQDFTEQSNLAKAKDAIAQFNAQNSQQVAAASANAKNSAQQFNLTNAQNVNNMNTESANKEQIANKGLQQTQFNNQLGLANAKAGQYNANAGASQTQAGNTAGMWAGIGQGAGTGLAGLGKLFGNSNPTAVSSATPGNSAGSSIAFDPKSYA
jgi:hypothetical protein